jgi:putative ABC transport system permease protein
VHVFIILRVALKALARNKMRTGLTMLGMIIGVASLISMVALGTGAQQQIQEEVRTAGTNLIVVRAGNFRGRGISTGMGGAPTLTAKDVDAIREQVPGAIYLAASVNTRDQVIAGSQNWSTQIEGTDIEFPMIRFWDLQYGAFFTQTHVQSAAKVAVVGSGQ